MPKKSKETVFILTKADQDRIEAAIGLMRLIIRELMATRRTHVNCERHNPSALYELSENLEKLREEQLRFTGI